MRVQTTGAAPAARRCGGWRPGCCCATPTAVIGLSAVTCMLAGVTALCVPALHRLPARRA